MRRWRRLRGFWPAIVEDSPSALAGIAIVIAAAFTGLLTGLILAFLTTMLY